MVGTLEEKSLCRDRELTKIVAESRIGREIRIRVSRYKGRVGSPYEDATIHG